MNNIKKSLGIILIVIFAAVPAFSLDFIAGVKAGYYVWEPYLKDIDANNFDEIDKGEGFLTGPVVSILITENLSLSLTALYGKQTTHCSTLNDYQADIDRYITGVSSFESRRLDLDGAISYSILRYIKVFAGYKYQRINSKVMLSNLRTDSSGTIMLIHNAEFTAKTPSSGPALGVGISYPFRDWFFAAANISGLYMKGDFYINNEWRQTNENLPYTSVAIEDDPAVEFDTVQYGINIEPAVGVLAKEINLVFTLGFRYQYLKTEVEDAEEVIGKTKLNDTIYGVFISVLYSF
jgi:hypothetical protein